MVAAFDEMKGQDGGVRPAYGELARWLADVPADVLDYRRREAELIFRRIGITLLSYPFGCTFAWPEACKGEPWKATNVRSKQALLKRLSVGAGNGCRLR